MSDFLTRLAQRQLGQIATIEPRLPGLHAPLAEEALFRDTGVGSEGPSSAVTEAENISMSRRTSARLALTAPAASSDPSTGSVPSRHQPLAGEKRPGSDRSIQIETENVNPQIPRSEEIPAAVSPPAGATLPLEHRAIDLPAEAYPAQPAHESSPLPERGSVGEENTASAARAVLRPLVEPKELDKISAAQSIRAVVEPAGITRRANSLRERTRMDVLEPPVQVSIGRIEVTAVTVATPPKPAPKPRKQGMTLEAYLARRQRGQR